MAECEGVVVEVVGGGEMGQVVTICAHCASECVRACARFARGCDQQLSQCGA